MKSLLASILALLLMAHPMRGVTAPECLANSAVLWLSPDQGLKVEGEKVSWESRGGDAQSKKVSRTQTLPSPAYETIPGKILARLDGKKAVLAYTSARAATSSAGTIFFLGMLEAPKLGGMFLSSEMSWKNKTGWGVRLKEDHAVDFICGGATHPITTHKPGALTAFSIRVDERGIDTVAYGAKPVHGDAPGGFLLGSRFAVGGILLADDLRPAIAGDICEVIICDKYLCDNEMQSVWDYLAATCFAAPAGLRRVEGAQAERGVDEVPDAAAEVLAQDHTGATVNHEGEGPGVGWGCRRFGHQAEWQQREGEGKQAKGFHEGMESKCRTLTC